MRAAAPMTGERRPWVTAPLRWLAWCWRVGGIRGRLTAGVVLSITFALGYAFADPGVSTTRRIAAIIAGATGVALFSAWLEWVQVRDKRRWRERKARVIPGGLVKYFPDADVIELNKTRIAELEAAVASGRVRMEEIEADLDALRETLAAAYYLGGHGAPPSVSRQPERHLKVVSDGTGPIA